MPRDLIVFGEDWGAHPSSTQHLVSRLGSDRRILWVNSIGLRQPRLGLADLGRVVDKIGRSLRGGARETRGPVEAAPFPVLNPLTIPAPRSRPARALAAAMLTRQVRGAAVAAGLRDPVIWTSLPTAVDVLDRLAGSAVVYYCGDDFGGLAGVDHGVVTAREGELAQVADLVITASDALAARFPAERTRVLHHGVDFDHFSTPVARAAELPAADRNVAGFYGSVSDWLDLPLLEEAAKALPDWEFVFVGNVHVDVSALTALPNVRFLGPRPHAELPSFSQHWTVSMLPFVDNAQIRACNPLKLREYLATGKPVVATPFPALAPYREVVGIADGLARFVQLLQESVADCNSQRRMDAVRGETWDARAALLDGWLEDL